MVKLSLSSGIGILSLANGGAAASSAASSVVSNYLSSSSSPAALHHIHHHLVHQKLRDVLPKRQTSQPPIHARRHAQVVVTEEDDNCPYTPFLWKIIEDDSGKHVGFGLGTMHLPVDVVTSVDAYQSILAAIEDSCDVYGEINLVDSITTDELIECESSIVENSATVENIPDEELREAIKSKIMAVGKLMSPDNDEDAAILATRLLTLPLPEVQRIILYANTPEYVDKYLHTIYSNSGTVLLDTHLLSLGRPADDLEEVSTQCDLLDELHTSAEELNQTFDMYSTSIKNSLDASLTEEIQLYTCGDIDAFVEQVSAGVVVDDITTEGILTERNEQMAEKISSVLKGNPAERVLFAVGVAHWTIGGHNLELLLKDYGYSLEHIPEWSNDHAENHSNEHCDVMMHPETGLFVPAEGWAFAPSPSITMEPTHTLVLDQYSTQPPTEKMDLQLVNVTTSPTMVPDSDETFSPTKKPSAGDAGEGGQPSSSTMIGTSKIILVSGLFYLWCQR